MLNVCLTEAVQRIYKRAENALCISFQREFALVIGNAFRGGGEEMELRLVLHIHTHISALFRNTVPLHMCSSLSKYLVICVAAAL